MEGGYPIAYSGIHRTEIRAQHDIDAPLVDWLLAMTLVKILIDKGRGRQAH